MVERRKPIPVREAIDKILQMDFSGETEWVPINQSYGRYLAEDLKAANDVPHFDRSPYDGFAVRAADTAGASADSPVEFEVVDHIGAGYVAKVQVGAYQAARIMTGAQMPAECDAVVMLELARTEERDGKNFMSIKRSFKSGDNVSFQGEDAKEGDILLRKGKKINPGVIAMLATFGCSKVPVAKKPAIGLFATGTELLDVDEALEPGRIRNSNSHMVMAQIERSGAACEYYGKLPDDFDTCFTAIEAAIEKTDILVTTGGVSVGDYDYLPAIYQKLGAEVLFNKVAMRPGSVTTVARLGGKLLFGLSGNPSACYVGFELFVRPVIRGMLYTDKIHLRMVQAALGEDFPKPNPFTRFVRSRLEYENGRLISVPSGVDKSNIVMSLAGADALMVLPGGTRGYQRGDEVHVLLLEDDQGSSQPW